MKLSLITAIRYLEENHLAENEIIFIECWRNDGPNLQRYVREFAGFLYWIEPFPDAGPEFKILLKELSYQDLCLQFIDSYPNVDDKDNLRIMIMHRSKMMKLLGKIDSLETREFKRNPRLFSIRPKTFQGLAADFYPAAKVT